jgi:benzoyl-CoA reductase/2-hydroxyglutaryl-CoA dehydratase subunit BcrC/BadD/HgdB
VGYVCRYAPLPLIHASGRVPYRILPLGDPPDGAGSVLHDNLCPHVKVVLSRALGEDLPPLDGVVMMNSCDAMRRLADAWAAVRPEDRLVAVDLPLGREAPDVACFTAELERLQTTLESWSGSAIQDQAVSRSTRLYRDLALEIEGLAQSAPRARVQELSNRAVTSPPQDVLAELQADQALPEAMEEPAEGVPVLLLGNVLPDPAAHDLLASCGVRVVDDDLCTGSRQLLPFEIEGGEPPLRQLARQLLELRPCARAVDPLRPGQLPGRVVAHARACGARGVIAHVMKFCDPYLVRLPAVRVALREAGLPLLSIEGDCTLRSLGQHRTRIEAFVEMLQGAAS